MALVAERSNGKVPYNNRTYGGFRRGVVATPSPELIGYQRNKSRFDKERQLASIKERRLAKQQLAHETATSLGQVGLETASRALSAVSITTPETTALAQENIMTPEQQSLERSDLGNKELPAYKYKNEIIDLIENNRASALGGETGSGKSTQIPQYLLEAGYDLVVMLEPRRISADFLCDRVRDELADQIDEDARQLVGVIHGERVETSEHNKIKVMTADTFNATATKLEKEYAGKKVAIIADEVHEANVFTEIAIGVAGMAVQRNESWRLVAVSATQNLETLRRPFSLVNTNSETELAELPFAEIAGRPHEVEFHEAPDKNVMEAYAALKELPEKTLVFTSGKMEIEHIINGIIGELGKCDDDLSRGVEFRRIHGELTAREMEHLKDEAMSGRKLVYVATPAAMSSITIPGITHVFTDGTINRKEIDNEGGESLVRRYMSKSEITQQIGRAGRDVDGGIGVLCKPTAIAEDRLRKEGKQPPNEIMPFRSFDVRADFAPAEIYSTNLARAVLRVANLGMLYQEVNPYTPHRVEGSTINNAEMALIRIGGLDDDAAITDIGKKMDAFPLMPELSRGMVEATLRQRSSLQLARMAMIAAAIDLGGIQEYGSGHENSGWLHYVHGGATDDFILQLDLMTAVNQIRRRNEVKWERAVRQLRQKQLDETTGVTTAPDVIATMDTVAAIADTTAASAEIKSIVAKQERDEYFLREHDLNPKRTERALKTAQKCLKILGINLKNIEFAPLAKEEERMLHHDFTAGMIDLVYEESKRIHRDVYYKNIHGDSQSTARRIHSYGTHQPERGSLIAGFPYNQRVINKKTAEVSFKPIINRFMTVEPADVIEFAKLNNILRYKQVAPRVEGDYVVELAQPVYGNLEVGPPEVRKTGEYISSASCELLIKSSLEKPGRAQRLLRAVAEELAMYHQQIPPDELNRYRNPTDLPEITKKEIERLVRTYAKSTRSMSELDAKLSQYMYEKGIEIGRYYSSEALDEMRQRSPDHIMVGGSRRTVYYDKGTPYIIAKGLQRKLLPELVGQQLHLEDGREVLLQTQHMDKKVRVSLVVYVNNFMAAQNQAQ